MLRKEEILLIVYFILVILFLAAFTIFFFITYQRRKNKIFQEKFQAEQQFKTELTNARIEIQEATLKNVSWELHDNIGQLLSIASIQISLLKKNLSEKNQNGLQEVKELVAISLSEVRALSRSLNNEVIEYAGLETSVRNEINRFNRLGVIQADLEIKGTPYTISHEDSIILFRILQEFFSNMIKYAGASHLKVKFSYQSEFLEIQAVEDGKGFDPDGEEPGSGFMNMRSRAAMIHTNLNLNSSLGKGTSLSLRYPTKTKPHEQNDHNR